MLKLVVWCAGVASVLLALPFWQPALAAGMRDDLTVGVSIAGISPWSVAHAREAGFSHMRHSLHWSDIEKSRGRFPWERDEPNHLDNVLGAASQGGLGLVLRLDGGPRSAGGAAAHAPLHEVTELYHAVAARAYPHLTAIEVLNEPNLPPEWGGDADPDAYVAYLRAAYEGVKSVTPDVIVIAGNLSPAPQGPGTMDDLDFLAAMYRAGAQGSFDAIGVHNYGGASEPEQDPSTCEICFRRAERARQIMVEAGDDGTPIWSTEMGWLLETDEDLEGFNWMKLPSDLQSEYLARSITFASREWPWMQGLLLFNLDHSAAPWHGPSTSMYWFSLLNPDYSPRESYESVRAVLR